MCFNVFENILPLLISENISFLLIIYTLICNISVHIFQTNHFNIFFSIFISSFILFFNYEVNIIGVRETNYNYFFFFAFAVVSVRTVGRNICSETYIAYILIFYSK